MNYKLLNEALSDISTLRRGTKYPKVLESKIDNLQGSSSQGEYDEYIEVYSLGDNIYIKLVLITDSYGDNETLNSIQLVKPIERLVTDFEIIK
jgi:hypothetical protein